MMMIVMLMCYNYYYMQNKGNTAFAHLPPLVLGVDLTADDGGVWGVPQVTTHRAPRLVIEPPHLHSPFAASGSAHQSQLDV